MTFYKLTNVSLPAVKLHRPHDVESRRICCVARNPNKDEPFLVGGSTVVDNLGTGEG